MYPGTKAGGLLNGIRRWRKFIRVGMDIVMMKMERVKTEMDLISTCVDSVSLRHDRVSKGTE